MEVSAPPGWQSRALERFNRPYDATHHALICVPHAGAGVAVFGPLAGSAPADFDVVAVRLPGRETLFMVPPLRDMTAVVAHLVGVLGPDLPASYSLFGQCSGAYIALELARRLSAESGRPPRCVFVASQLPISAATAVATRDEDIERYVDALVDNGELHPVLAAHGEYAEILRDVLRADLEVIDSYAAAAPHEPIDVPIVALCGTRDDPQVVAGQQGWREHTRAGFTVRTLDRGHFLTSGDPAALMAELVAEPPR